MTGRESIDSLSQKLGMKDSKEEDVDINMTDGPGVVGPPAGVDGKDKGKGWEEGGPEGKGDQALGASKHAEKGKEGRKGAEEADSSGRKVWDKIQHQFPMHDSRALSNIIQDITDIATAIAKARRQGKRGTCTGSSSRRNNRRLSQAATWSRHVSG